MAKLEETKTKIIKRGYEQDYTFKDNVCPCCGNISHKVYTLQEIEKYSLILYHYKGRMAEIHCYECGTHYQKEIWDEKEVLPVSEIAENIFILLCVILFVGGIACIIAHPIFGLPLFVGGICLIISCIMTLIIAVFVTEDS